MRYHVRGISRATGKETTLVVNAKHHEAAEAIARREMNVSEVVPEGGLAEPEIFDPREFDDPPKSKDPTPATRQVPPKIRSSRRRWGIILAGLALLAGVVWVILKRGQLISR